MGPQRPPTLFLCRPPWKKQHLVKLKPTFTMFSATFQSNKTCRVNEPVARKSQKVAIDLPTPSPTAAVLLSLTPSFCSSAEPREGDSASLCRPVWTLWCGFCAAPRADRPHHEKQPAGDTFGPGRAVWTAGGQCDRICLIKQTVKPQSIPASFQGNSGEGGESFCLDLSKIHWVEGKRVQRVL